MKSGHYHHIVFYLPALVDLLWCHWKFIDTTEMEGAIAPIVTNGTVFGRERAQEIQFHTEHKNRNIMLAEQGGWGKLNRKKVQEAMKLHPLTSENGLILPFYECVQCLSHSMQSQRFYWPRTSKTISAQCHAYLPQRVPQSSCWSLPQDTGTNVPLSLESLQQPKFLHGTQWRPHRDNHVDRIARVYFKYIFNLDLILSERGVVKHFPVWRWRFQPWHHFQVNSTTSAWCWQIVILKNGSWF